MVDIYHWSDSDNIIAMNTCATNNVYGSIQKRFFLHCNVLIELKFVFFEIRSLHKPQFATLAGSGVWTPRVKVNSTLQFQKIF